LVALVPQNKREFTSQVFEAVGAKLFVQMQRYLAVGFGSESMAALFEFASLTLEIIELTIDDDPYALVFVGDGLVTGCEIDNAQAGVSQADALIGGNPRAATIRAAMMKRLGSEGYGLS
jgi:hypothetical protein